MSPFLPQIKAKDLVRVAKQLGFELDRQKGSHAVFYRDSDKARVVIPMQHYPPEMLHLVIERAASIKFCPTGSIRFAPASFNESPDRSLPTPLSPVGRSPLL